MRLPLSSLLLASLRLRLSHSFVTPCALGRGTTSTSSSSAEKKTPSTTMARHLSSSATNTAVNRILCYGDSLTAGTSTSPWELYPYAPHLEQALSHKIDTKCVVRHRGMPGWTVDAMLDAADDAQYGLRSAIRGIQEPALSCVIILAGTNDLGYAAASNEEERVSTIVTPVKTLHEMAWQEGVPRTLAIAIPPSGYQSQVALAAELARAVNEELEEFCRGSDGKAMFVPFPFEYERDGDNWCSDGLHFSPQGYQVLGEYLADPLAQVLKGMEE